MKKMEINKPKTWRKILGIIEDFPTPTRSVQNSKWSKIQWSYKTKDSALNVYVAMGHYSGNIYARIENTDGPYKTAHTFKPNIRMLEFLMNYLRNEIENFKF